MSEIEFAECMEDQCPQASERLRRRLFSETRAHMPGERDIVPCSRLACILMQAKIEFCATAWADLTMYVRGNCMILRSMDGSCLFNLL